MKSSHWIAGIGALIASLLPIEAARGQDETTPATRPAAARATPAKTSGPRISEMIGRELRNARGEEPRRHTNVDPNRTERDVPPVAREEARELEQFPVGMFEPRNVRILNGAITSIIEQSGRENDFGVGIRLLVKRDDQSTRDSD